MAWEMLASNSAFVHLYIATKAENFLIYLQFHDSFVNVKIWIWIKCQMTLPAISDHQIPAVYIHCQNAVAWNPCRRPCTGDQNRKHTVTEWVACKRAATGFLAATKQLYDWFSPSVCPSVRPSVRPSVTPFSPCSHHRIIMKFSGVITNDKSDVHVKGHGQRSKVKVTEVTTQLNRFRTVTQVWIHIWWGNDAYSLMMLRRGALLFFKVIRQISRSHGSKKRKIWPRLGVSGL